MNSPSSIPRSILFVCLGNICRSPLAEGAFRARAISHGLADSLLIDSAGLGSWHIGNPPDPRAIRIAGTRGIDISNQSARQVDSADFDRFDLILGMDRSNLTALQRMAPTSSKARIGLFLDQALGSHADVPDPYYGDDAGFAEAIDLIDEASAALIDQISV